MRAAVVRAEPERDEADGEAGDGSANVSLSRPSAAVFVRRCRGSRRRPPARRAAVEEHVRRRLVGGLRRDPVHDLAVGVRLHGREDQGLPGLFGIFALTPNSSNSPGAIFPPSQVTVATRSLTVSPSIVSGGSSFAVVIVRFQPGFGWKLDRDDVLRDLHRELDRIGALLLVRHADRQAREAVRRHLLGADRHVGRGGGHGDERDRGDDRDDGA